MQLAEQASRVRETAEAARKRGELLRCWATPGMHGVACPLSERMPSHQERGGRVVRADRSVRGVALRSPAVAVVDGARS